VWTRPLSVLRFPSETVAQRSNPSPTVQLHNSLIVSIFDPSTHLVAALTPPPDVPKGPPRKRRRLLPYQGPDPDEPITLRSSRLKRWAVGIGRRERDRIRNLKPVALSTMRPPRPEVDEIADERGVRLLSERGGACVSSSSPEKVFFIPRRASRQSTCDSVGILCTRLHFTTYHRQA
jgi:hypothetical protein